MASIPISAKHGVNPTIPICFWCGGHKEEVALLGKLPRDKKAPMYTLIDYEPCKKCEEGMSKGITFIEVNKTPVINNQPSIAPGMYPTSRIAVIKEESVKAIIQDEDMLNKVISSKKCLIDSESWKGIGLPTEEDDHGN